MEIRGRCEWKVALASAIALSASVHCGCLQLTPQVKRWGSMQLSNPSQVTQQIWSISRTWTKTGWNESPCALYQHLCWSGQTPTGQWVSICRDIAQRIRKLSSYQLMLEAVLPCLRTRQAGPLPWPSTLHFGMPSLSSPPLSGNNHNHQYNPGRSPDRTYWPQFLFLPLGIFSNFLTLYFHLLPTWGVDHVVQGALGSCPCISPGPMGRPHSQRAAWQVDFPC